jgi:type VI protein secretion system component Hcp
LAYETPLAYDLYFFILVNQLLLGVRAAGSKCLSTINIELPYKVINWSHLKRIEQQQAASVSLRLNIELPYKVINWSHLKRIEQQQAARLREKK